MNKNKVWRTAIYCRLSNDDKDLDTSNSIINQGKLIKDFLKNKNSFNVVDVYSDDGYTGTNFKRPEFIRMIDDIYAGKINCIVVKDLSRFGREYIESGRYLESVFPENNIRFISVFDNIDSHNEKKQLKSVEMPLRNLINEQYAADISRKTKSSLEAKSRAGKYIGVHVPYGYKRDPKDKNKLVIDNNVSENVVEIFKLFISGKGIKEIAKIFNEQGILSPLGYQVNQGIKKLPKSANPDYYTFWHSRQVRSILGNYLYTGDLVYGQTKNISHKNKKRVPVPKEQWIIVKETHGQIINHFLFNNVQDLLSRGHKQYITEQKTSSIFAGFLFCDECCKPMVRSQTHGKADFLCSSYCRYGSKVCNSHLIYEDKLLDLTTTEIKKFIDCNFNNIFLDKTNKEMNGSIIKIERDIVQLNKSIKESENALTSCYEDYKSGILSEDEFIHIKKYIKEKIPTYKDNILLLEEEKNKIIFQIKNYKKYIKNVVKKIDKHGLSREIIVFLVDKIEISNDKRINITYKSIFL